MTIRPGLRAAVLLALGLLASAAQALTWGTLSGDALDSAGTLTLTTAYLDGADDQPYNVSGQSALDIALIEARAGVPAYALDLSASEYATEGSLATLQFSVAAQQTLSFAWQFATRETQFQDHAFAVLNGQVFTLATRSQPGGTLQTFSHTFGQAGVVTLAVGVVDTVDVLGVSTLSVQNLQVSAVPEPATWALALGGGLLLAARARRR